jgi:hypothetical protein
MSLVDRTPRRCVPVRLTEVPLKVRLKAARAVIREETDNDVRLEILLRAYSPTDQTYFIAA